MFEGIVACIIGLIAIIFHKPWARMTTNYYDGRFGIKITPWVRKFTEVGFIIVGTFFIITGILQLLGIIKFQ